MKRLMLLLGVMAFAVGIPTSHVLKGNNKVEICHIPPGNPCNAHVIEVSVNALDTHNGHCGVVDECTVCENDQPNAAELCREISMDCAIGCKIS